MKKILLGLFFAMFAMQVNAAAITIDDTDIFSLSQNIKESKVTTAGFTDTHTMTLVNSAGNTGFMANFTLVDHESNTMADLAAVIKNAAGNVVFSFGSTAISTPVSGLFLETGVYSVIISASSVVSGAIGFPETYTFGVDAAAVPLPAAVWLFGSALMGLFGASRRKSTAVAA